MGTTGESVKITSSRSKPYIATYRLLEERARKTETSIERLQAESDIEINRQDNTSRSRIASRLTWAFIVAVFVIIIGVPLYNAVLAKKELDVVQILASFGSLFGTSLGFVLGYYFKDRKS